MKKILLMALFAIASISAFSQNPVTVCISDNTGSPTNVRNAPNGKIVYQIPQDLSCTVDIISVKNGWWKITPEVDTWGDDETTILLKGSSTGYWLHKSMLGFAISGDSEGCLRVAPSNSAKAVKVLRSDYADLVLEPLMIKGSWIKVVTKDKKYTGWMPIDRICYNPLTTCP